MAKKAKHAVRRKKPVRLEDKTLTDMELFYRLANWAEWWEEWFFKIDRSGRPLYKTVRQFAFAKKKSPQQYEFLLWLMGENKADVATNAKYKFAGIPQDWHHKRETGGWFTSDAIQQLTKKVRVADDALTALRETGNDVVVPFVYQIKKLVDKAHQAFRGEFFTDDLSLQDNFARSRAYIDLLNQLFRLMKQSIELQALTNGVNFSDMSGFAQLIAGMQLYNAGLKGAAQSKAEECISEIVKMTMIKAKTFDLPLPESMQEVVETTLAEEPEVKKNKPN